MSHPGQHRAALVRYLPGRLTVAAVAAGAGVAWLVALVALIPTLLILPDIGVSLVVVGGSSLAAVWATRKAAALHRLVSDVPVALLEKRQHGRLSGVADGPRRPLRPIGADVFDVAASTDVLLAELVTIPGIRVFRAPRPAGSALPPVSHAVCAARVLILVESVAWPPGCYRTDADNRVRCDGQYIGQSVRPLVTAVRQLRRLLPRSHRVGALVVVHRTADGDYVLPLATRELDWAFADDLIRYLRDRTAHRRPLVSRHSVAALTPAASEEVVTS